MAGMTNRVCRTLLKQTLHIFLKTESNATTPDEDKQKTSDQEIKHMTKRTKLPVKQPDKNNANLWSFLKQCIGKELTRISMPVQWNEPISLLQRVAEYMNYAYLLKKAAVAKVSFIILRGFTVR